MHISLNNIVCIVKSKMVAKSCRHYGIYIYTHQPSLFLIYNVRLNGTHGTHNTIGVNDGDRKLSEYTVVII